MAETFKLQMNFDFRTEICFDLLDLLINANLDLFEYTQIDDIIDFIFEQNKVKFIIFNMVYVGQAIFVSINELYPHLFSTTVIICNVLAIVILSIEFFQFVQAPKDYITSIYNWLEASGNILVILV